MTRKAKKCKLRQNYGKFVELLETTADVSCHYVTLDNIMHYNNNSQGDAENEQFVSLQRVTCFTT